MVKLIYFILVSLLFNSAIVLAHSDISSSGADSELLKTDPQLVFIAEDHKNSNLAAGVYELINTLKDKNFNYLFLELPISIQSKLDDSISKNSVEQFWQIINRSRLEFTVQAYRNLGVLPPQLENIRLGYIATEAKPWPTFPFNEEILNLANKKIISVIAFDVEEDSPYLYQSLLGSLKSSLGWLYGKKSEDPFRYMESADQRSQFMSKNINRLYHEKKCNKAIVAVGYRHLDSEDFFNKTYKTNLKLNPIHETLERDGYNSVVLKVNQVINVVNPNIDFNTKYINEFSSYVGELLTPGK